MGMKAGKWTKAAADKGLGCKTTTVNLTALSASGNSKGSNVPSAALELISEAVWQDMVVAEATFHGWKVAHCRKVLVKNGKRTHWETTMPKGWFDLVLARDSNRSHRDSVYYVELKVEPNVQEPEQKEWEKLMTACGQTCFLWYPKHWDVVKRILSKPVAE